MEAPKNILFMFGGVSAEHEVSVVSGLQALESLDASLYAPVVIYIGKKGEMWHLPGVTDRSGFLGAKKSEVSFGRDSKGGYVEARGLFGNWIYPYAAFLAFHGGSGEGGSLQGLLESSGIPFTSSSTEGSVIAMNKRLTKEVLREAKVPVLPDVQLFASDIRAEVETAARSAIGALGLPLIIKPVHLGSSIGINVAHTEIELQKGLLTAAFSDEELLLEPFLEGIREYNCAVRRVGDVVEVSEIEKPVSHDAILSFADKYERGGKKVGSGMASLSRELPAKIPPELKQRIQDAARRAFIACRLKGMARIDFMQSEAGDVYLTEVNPIPGSMAFYLWEASGIPFRTQITDLIEQAVRDAEQQADLALEYKSDIIERFVQSPKH